MMKEQIDRKGYVQAILDAFGKLHETNDFDDGKLGNCLDRIDDFEEFTLEQERLAFADWLEKLLKKHDYKLPELIEAKIKELRSNGKDK